MVPGVDDHEVCLCCGYPTGSTASVAVADVPDPELSTIMVAGLIPLAEPLTAQFPLTLLLLKHLQGDAGKFRSAGEDAVGIELHCFVVHTRKIGWIQEKVNRLGTVPRPSHAVEHFGNCLLVFFIGGEAVSEPSGNLTNGTVDWIATLLDHLLSVGVLCFVHEPIIGTRSDGLGSLLCHLSNCPRAAALSIN